MIARILAPFSNEPALVGELVEINRFNSDGEMRARLLGNSDYIRNNTDGYVTVTSTEVETVEPYVGMPATVHLHSDSFAAVVVRVNPKSITVSYVADDPKTERRINAEGEPYPCIAVDGILTDLIGKPERFARVETSDGSIHYRNGSISVSLGRSVTVRDHRY